MTSALLPARRARWPLLLILLFVHALVFVSLNGHQRLPADPETSLLLVQIAPPPPQRIPPPPEPRDAPPPRLRTYAPRPEVQITAPAIEDLLAVAPLPPASAASGVAPTSKPKLNLALPIQMQATGPTAKELTSNDLHAGQPNKKSIEFRIADAAGTLPVETLTTTDGLGSTMVRQGTKCTKIVANRLSTIDPFDSRAKLPPTSGDCFKK